MEEKKEGRKGIIKKKKRETRIIQRRDTVFLLTLKRLRGGKSIWRFHSPDDLSNPTDSECQYRFLFWGIKRRQQYLADTETDPPF